MSCAVTFIRPIEWMDEAMAKRDHGTPTSDRRDGSFHGFFGASGTIGRRELVEDWERGWRTYPNGFRSIRGEGASYGRRRGRETAGRRVNIPQPSEDRGNVEPAQENAGYKEFHLDPPPAAAGVLPWSSYELVSAVLQRRRAEYRAEYESLPVDDEYRRMLMDRACEMSDLRLELMELTFEKQIYDSKRFGKPADDEGDSSP